MVEIVANDFHNAVHEWRRCVTQNELKALVGQAATAYIEPGAVIGVGTGSTVNCFIDALGRMPQRIEAAVSSSNISTLRLQALGIMVVDANAVETLAVYVDGADEIDHAGCMIKGGGAALTREKIVADMAQRFICIADSTKLVQTLGKFALPVEVIPMAANHIAKLLRTLGGQPVLRAGTVTDNGGHIIDVHGLSIAEPAALEREINQWPGVVSVGLFARNKANICLLGTPQGVQTLRF
jgi:ribose 5-phosphate isomerase A